MTDSSTIFALATPYAKSGVAILRLSGKQSLAALIKLSEKNSWQADHMQYTTLRHPENRQVIDRCLAVYFAAPHSFTGEEVVELHLHGSLAVIRELLSVLTTMPGMRMAERGEFTRRAVLNGKMDMVEAEGLADLIDAETTEQRSQAMRQMQGEMSSFYETLRRQVIATLAHMEAYIDFPDEDIPASVYDNLNGEVSEVIAQIEKTIRQHRIGERIREGIYVVILGAPNAGKSSILNSLSKKDAAIVSHQAGTTRDVIEVHMDIAGFPVILVDTAGLRESTDLIEEEGVKRALQRAEQADIKLLCFDTTQPPDDASLALRDERTITLYTKADVADEIPSLSNERLLISTVTGDGIEPLLKLIEERVCQLFSGEGAVITRNRHRQLLIAAQSHLDRFFVVNELELKCEELRLAAGYIGKITGKIAVDDVLDVIFKEFCIGK